MKFTALPCPFCGSIDHLEFQQDPDTLCVLINCNAVKGGCGMRSGYAKDFQAQVEKWNERTHAKVAQIDSEDAQTPEDFYS